MKICTTCKIEKSVEDFYKSKSTKDCLCYICKKCTKEKIKNWRKLNPDKKLAGDRQRRKDNIKKIKQQKRLYYKANKEKIIKAAKKNYEKNRNKKIQAAAEWKKTNREKARKSACKTSRKMRSTSRGKLNSRISYGVWNSLKGNKNDRHWESLVDFTISKLKKHLEKQFQPGMNWNNYGKWHIDHKIPISKFNFKKSEDDDFKKCWSLNNLQPLWAKDNLKKWNKLDKPFQPSLIFN